MTVNIELQLSALYFTKNKYQFRSGAGKDNKQFANKELLEG